MTDDHVDSKRRRLLTIATTSVGLVGAAGLVFVLNAKSGKSAFSDAGPVVEPIEMALNE